MNQSQKQPNVFVLTQIAVTKSQLLPQFRKALKPTLVLG